MRLFLVTAFAALAIAATAAAVTSAPFAVPGAPDITSCNGSEHYTLTWLPVPGALHYNLWRITPPANIPLKVGTVAANKLSAAFVIPCSHVDIGVSAANGEGDGPISSVTVSNQG